MLFKERLFEYMSYCLLITLKGNSQFEYMSYYLLVKLLAAPNRWSRV